MKRVSALVVGTVQGVGFRPFVQRAATRHGVSGAAWNLRSGVRVEAQGEEADVEAFLRAVARESPGSGVTVGAVESLPVDAATPPAFVIRPSEASGPSRASLPPDLAPCAACLAEVRAAGRRHRYPFTSCTACGPRASIALGGPWDRGTTTMAPFAPCEACLLEYRDPADRRCHAQTLACPACGPELWLEARGERAERGDAALSFAVDTLRTGGIVAAKGVGGWQLWADATNEAAVAELRRRKGRPAKPFAVMFRDLESAERASILGDVERAALAGPAAPIVLVRARSDAGLADAVAPGRRLTGAMLPSSLLHAILADDLGRPVVCTSGNASGEPLAIDDDEARRRLGPLAEVLLGHGRAIARPLDDSVTRVSARGPIVLRCARGLAPRTLVRHEPGPVVLALGAHLKSTVTLAHGSELRVSAHLGDLSSPLSVDLLERTAREMVGEAGVRPEVIACDLHPDLASTRLAERLAEENGAVVARIPHHAAHVAAALAEHRVEGPLLGLAWDGLGLGEDGALWGGEALVLSGSNARRVAHLLPFPLPGGEAAIREPRRAALGLLHAAGLSSQSVAASFSAEELGVLESALRARVNAPSTTSMGRLFDAVAALVGLSARARFEAEAAMTLEESALDVVDSVEPYPWELGDAAPSVLDWRPTLRALLADVEAGAPVGVISARFHASLGWLAGELVRRERAERVALVGGCFQNVRLVDAVTRSVEAAGATVLVPRALPPGDGALSVGQALVASRRFGHVPRHSG